MNDPNWRMRALRQYMLTLWHVGLHVWIISLESTAVCPWKEEGCGGTVCLVEVSGHFKLCEHAGSGADRSTPSFARCEQSKKTQMKKGQKPGNGDVSNPHTKEDDSNGRSAPSESAAASTGHVMPCGGSFPFACTAALEVLATNKTPPRTVQRGSCVRVEQHKVGRASVASYLLPYCCLGIPHCCVSRACLPRTCNMTD